MKYDLVVQIWCFELEESIIWSYLCWFYTCNWVSFIFWSSFCVDYFWSFELTVVCEILKILYTYKHTRRTFCTESNVRLNLHDHVCIRILPIIDISYHLILIVILSHLVWQCHFIVVTSYLGLPYWSNKAFLSARGAPLTFLLVTSYLDLPYRLINLHVIQHKLNGLGESWIKPPMIVIYISRVTNCSFAASISIILLAFNHVNCLFETHPFSKTTSSLEISRQFN